MSRIINQPVAVTSRPSARPGARGPEPVVFTCKGARYRVREILDSWEETGRWWEQEEEATAWRVRLQSGGIVELVMLHSRPAPTWIWYKSYD